MKRLNEYIKPYTQRYDWSCGAATLLVCYRTLGIEDYTEEELIKELETSKGGTYWENMKNHPTELGFEVRAEENADLNKLEKVFKKGYPVVAFWMDDRNGFVEPHYSVIKHIDKNKVVLVDTTWGDLIEFTKEEWLTRWDNGEGMKFFMTILPGVSN
ncbi:MAG: hypothetical protein UT63_C0060G0010 [Candidatus Gottesmanbacteria bacterium GW2011_GWC2_39_8]|uniref:Peptidase C39 domain-containing protein n=1 Tax=Candidatus Gottesmanbacteria bacterium GW2011_GWC2_39_8 TaxID=1618450 RepID=A0A0G0T1U8_9BACT|nr:MAG: hypothetical protein UT63_C0060G0010 [Candidatus Gottesmanbacteria bacterium GW2011_GWC2_39_8]